jgi:poly-beta-hydroxybutyrate-responsive repressor
MSNIVLGMVVGRESDDKPEAARRRADSGRPPRGTPKRYLMAWLLVMLKGFDLHGYEIMKALKDDFAVVSDPGTVYRTLRELERNGYIASRWNSTEPGPARRIYTLTESGIDALNAWTLSLEQYRTHLDAFFRLLTGPWREGGP